MKRMFLAQSRINETILYCMLVDIVIGFILKKSGADGHLSGAVALLYLMNLAVLAGVYRFWKFPIFEWGEKGFIFYGVSPFKKNAGLWEYAESAGFRVVETKRGKKQELLVILFKDTKGRSRTGAVPMHMVGFPDKVKQEFLATLREKRVKRL